jgi:hypothetical protein
VEAFAGTVTIGFNRLLAPVRIDDLDRHDWCGELAVGSAHPLDHELRPGLTLVCIAEAGHPRSGQVALAVMDASDEAPELLVLRGELAFRAC